MNLFRWIVFAAAALAVPLIAGCGDSSQSNAAGEVVVYTALDQIYSEPILKEFEAETGIQVRAVYDSEAAKTTGLVNRLIAERERPRCDVFWNNEIIRTIQLKREGILESYRSPSGATIPDAFKDSENCWAGFAARARVLVFNTEKLTLDQVPRSLEQLAEPKWASRLGMAYPLFGTTATHGAVLFAEWGEAEARAVFDKLNAGGVHILDGNMTVCRAVADGELDLGLTDTDDAHLLRSQGKPIDWILLDHRGAGALLIPNTVALMKNAPNPQAGRKLIDFLLRPEIEARLAASPSAQIPLHPGVEAPPKVSEMAREKFLEADYAAAAEQIEPSADFLKALFSRP